MISNKMKGNAALLFTALIWGSGFIAQKLGMSVLPPLAFNGIRQLCAGIVLSPILIVALKKNGYFSREKNSYEQIIQRRKSVILGGFVCGAFLMLGTNLQQVGLVTVSAGKSGFITAIYIVLVPLFSIFFGKKLTLKTVFCCTLAMVGFAFLSLRGGLGNITQGDLLTFVSAVFFACQIIAVNNFVTKDNDLLLSVLQMLISGAVTLVISLIFESFTFADVMQCVPILAYTTFLPTAMGYTLQIVGQKYTDATTASFLMSLESVFSVIFGALILHEVMSGKELLGCVLIFAANIIVQIEDRPKLLRSPQDSSGED